MSCALAFTLEEAVQDEIAAIMCQASGPVSLDWLTAELRTRLNALSASDQLPTQFGVALQINSLLKQPSDSLNGLRARVETEINRLVGRDELSVHPSMGRISRGFAANYI